LGKSIRAAITVLILEWRPDADFATIDTFYSDNFTTVNSVDILSALMCPIKAQIPLLGRYQLETRPVIKRFEEVAASLLKLAILTHVVPLPPIRFILDKALLANHETYVRACPLDKMSSVIVSLDPVCALKAQILQYAEARE
jgi:hypothetical protein